MKTGRKRAERQFLCSTPKELLVLIQEKKSALGIHTQELKADICIFLTQEEHKHLSLSLRLKVGNQVSLLDKELSLKYPGVIKSITKERTEVKIASYSYQIKPEISAIIGISDQKVLDFLAEKLCELGTDKIIFFKSEFSSAQSASKNIKLERLQKIKDGALKQSGSYSDTKISIQANLEGALEIVDSDTLKISLHPPDDKEWTSLTHLLEKNRGATKIVYAIGPEGGFSDRELRLLVDKNFHVAGLATNTLKVDTACIVTSAIIMQYLNNR